MCSFMSNPRPDQRSWGLNLVVLIKVEFGFVHTPSVKYNVSCGLQGGPSASCVVEWTNQQAQGLREACMESFTSSMTGGSTWKAFGEAWPRPIDSEAKSVILG